MNRACFTFLFLIIISLRIAKAQPTLDTIINVLKDKPHLYLKIDSRNSFIANRRAKILGLKLGFNFGNRLHLGIGFNNLYGNKSNFDERYYFYNHSGIRDSLNAELILFYFSTYAEYIFYQTPRWQLSMPLQLGIGKTYFHFLSNGEYFKIQEKLNFIYEPAISIEYKFLKWLGAGADVGYRFMLTTQHSRVERKFNSPTYAFKIIFYYNEIYKSIFPNSKLSSHM